MKFTFLLTTYNELWIELALILFAIVVLSPRLKGKTLTDKKTL